MAGRGAALGALLALASVPGPAAAQSYTLRQVLVRPTGGWNEHFGYPLAAIGGDLLVSAHDELLGSDPRTYGGAVYRFDLATGQVVQKLVNPNLPAGGASVTDDFGHSVAVLGSEILVGCQFDDTAGSNAGAAYLFDGASGALVRTFQDPDPTTRFFGARVAEFGGNVLVQGGGNPVTGERSVHLFDRATGALIRTFPSPNPEVDPSVGLAAEACGSVLATAAGAAYLLDATTGAVIHVFANPTPAFGDRFGYSAVALGDSVLVGAPGDDTFGVDAGAVYRFDCASGNLLQTYQSPTPRDDENFGWSIAVVGDDLLVGTYYASADGHAYLLDGATGSALQVFSGLSSNLPLNFGTEVAGVGPVIAVGGDGQVDEGAVLVFDFCGSGVLLPPEECDDGNLVNDDGCDANCTLTGCGNGIATSGEECDTGGDSETCDADCTVPVCGDGTPNAAAGELCDDGNLVDGDGCESDCFPTADLLSGSRILMDQDSLRPGRRALILESEDAGIVVPPSGSPGDPRRGGGALQILNPSTGESEQIRLPARRWRGNGTIGYRYRDRFGRSGPCRRVVVRPGASGSSLLRARCRGRKLDFTLDEPTQGMIAASLRLGSADPYCMEFGGTVELDFGFGFDPRVPTRGLFRGVEAPAPARCVVP